MCRHQHLRTIGTQWLKVMNQTRKQQIQQQETWTWLMQLIISLFTILVTKSDLDTNAMPSKLDVPWPYCHSIHSEYSKPICDHPLSKCQPFLHLLFSYTDLVNETKASRRCALQHISHLRSLKGKRAKTAYCRALEEAKRSDRPSKYKAAWSAICSLFHCLSCSLDLTQSFWF